MVKGFRERKNKGFVDNKMTRRGIMRKFLVVIGLFLSFSILCFADLQTAGDLFSQKKYAEAEQEYRNSLSSLKDKDLSFAQFRIGLCFELQKKYNEAISEYKKVATISGADPQNVSGAQFRIGCCLEAQGKIKEAQEEYLRMCSKRDSVFWLKQAFSKIDPFIVGKDKYVEYLNKLIMIIPATPENADFLGLLKSELEKLK